MPRVADVLSQIGNFWELIPANDRVAIKTLWTGYQMALSDLLLRLYQIDQAKSIRTIQPSVRREWFYLDLSYKNALDIPGSYSIESEIHRIPALQQGIYKEGVILQDTVDYVITSGLITFISPAARDVVDPVVALYDTVGTKNKAGVYVLDQGAPDLVGGTDYEIAGDLKTVRLKTKLAFDTFFALGEGSTIKALQDRVIWAPEVFIDEELVYRNFGILMDFPFKGSGYSLETYTRIVKGLWFIHWNGPTPNNIRNGLSLIFNYPTSPVKGRVTRLRFTAAPVFLLSQMPNGITTVPYTQQIPVGSDLPVTFEFVGGVLPPGLSINDEGILFGVPTSAGSFTIQVKATNARGFTTQNIYITIDGPPVFVTTSLPNASLNEFYSFVLNISTINPYTLTLLSGSLPPGVDLVPELKKIAGTPTSNGAFSFTLRATNAGGTTDQSYNLTVVAIPPDSGSIGPSGGGGLPDGLVD